MHRPCFLNRLSFTLLLITVSVLTARAQQHPSGILFSGISVGSAVSSQPAGQLGWFWAYDKTKPTRSGRSSFLFYFMEAGVEAAYGPGKKLMAGPRLSLKAMPANEPFYYFGVDVVNMYSGMQGYYFMRPGVGFTFAGGLEAGLGLNFPLTQKSMEDEAMPTWSLNLCLRPAAWAILGKHKTPSRYRR